MFESFSVACRQHLVTLWSKNVSSCLVFISFGLNLFYFASFLFLSVSAFFHIEAPPKIAPLSARRPIVLAPEAVALASRETSKFVKPEVTFSIFYKSLFQTSKRHAIDKSDNSLDLIVEVALRRHCDETLRWNTAMNVRQDNWQLLENKYCFGFV